MAERKPKGLTIYHRETGRVGLDGRTPAYELAAIIKGRGRTGARVRSLFARVSETRRQTALRDWSLGRWTEALS